MLEPSTVIPVDVAQLCQVLGDRLNRRQPAVAFLSALYDGHHPLPNHVRDQGLESEYALLMEMATSNWPRLIVDSVAERLEMSGIRFGGDTADSGAWQIIQENYLDADQGLVTTAALTTGRAFTLVWFDPERPGKAVITPESPVEMIVAYEAGSRRRRRAALKRYAGDDGFGHAVLYTPTALWKFRTREALSAYSSGSLTGKRSWVPFQPQTDKSWPLDNPLKVVPVIEHGANRRLEPAPFGSAHGEFEDVVPIVQRIDQTIFDRLLAQAYAAFPVRYLIGDDIDTDSNGNPKAPFQLAVNRLLQVENSEGKVGQLPESDLTNYLKSAEADIRHLAAITKTPPHYLLGELVNLSADAIRAAEAGLVSKVRAHQRVFGEAWEQTIRLAFLVMGDERANAMDAQVLWRNPEVRSEAQLADAAVKLKEFLPWQMLLEYLGYSPQDIAKAQALRASDALDAGLSASSALESKARADTLGVLIRAGVDETTAAQEAGYSGLTFSGARPVSLRLPEGESQSMEQ